MLTEDGQSRGPQVLDYLQVGNFKAFGPDQRLDLSPLTLIYGENSSGKSSLLQALLLLKQSFAGLDRFSRDPYLDFRGGSVDLGGFTASVHDHNEAASLRFTLPIRPTVNQSWFAGLLPERVDLEMRFSFDVATRRTAASYVRFNVRTSEQREEPLLLERRDVKGAPRLMLRTPAAFGRATDFWFGRHGLGLLVPGPDAKVDEDDIAWASQWLAGKPLQDERLVPIWSPDLLREGQPGRPVGGSLDSGRRYALRETLYFWEYLGYTLQSALQYALNRTHHVGPLRQPPERVTVESGSASRDLGPRGERLARVLAEAPALLARVNRALAALEIPYEVELRDLTEGAELGDLTVLTLRDRRTRLALTLGDVGVGVSQVLPVVAQLLMRQQSVIVLEQPELHLHPRLQARLADVMLESSLENGNTVVCETHSEHLLYRLQRRIAEDRAGSAGAEALRVYFVQASQSESLVVPVALGPDGELLEAWPGGFFDDRVADLLARQSASAR